MKKMWLFPFILHCSFLCADPIPVILDTDVGGDIDDTWAIGMLLGCPEIELKMIVTGTDDAPRKACLVAKILEKMERTDIPIGVGIKTSSNAIAQDQWLGDYDMNRYPSKVHQDGVQAMIELINSSSSPITLVLIGPQTNIREALHRSPGIAKKARVVAMAGSVEIGYNGRKGREPECNVVTDIPAAQAVLEAPWEITMVPLDGCGTLKLKGERYARVAKSEAPRAKTVIDNYRLWTHFKGFPEGESSVLFDTAAVALVFNESFFEMKTLKLRVDEKGNTVPDDEKGHPVRCAMDWKDREAFEKLLVKSLLDKR